MSLTNCKECNQPFHPFPDDIMPDFCDDCCDNYSVAFVEIHQFILRNEKPKGYKLEDIDLIVKEAHVPRNFVQRFFQDSELKKSILACSREMCKRCNISLTPDEKRYCKVCSEKMVQLVQNISGVNSAAAGARGRRSRGGRSRSRNNRYGLNRDG